MGSQISCPACDFSNIAGADICEQCGWSLSDLHPPTPASAIERALLEDQLDQLAPKTPIVVEPSMPVRQILRMLVDYKIGCVIVVKEGCPVGIFSERDALNKLNVRIGQLGDQPVSQFMSHDPETLEVDAKIAFAVGKMDSGGYRHLPIVDVEGRVTGIISVRDLLNYFTLKMTQK